MKPILAGAGAAILLLFAGFLAWAHRPAIAPVAPPAHSSFAPAEVARGEELARIGDCGSCHTVAGIAEDAGGGAVPTPFGTLYGANITPDPDTGIGRWSLAAFARALREGVSRDGRHLYPAFPYDRFTRLNDADIKALYAFLMTRPPVHAVPQPHRLPPPLRFRPLLAGWKALYLRPERFRPDPSRSTDWNNGAYLVEGPAHCASCHTPRNLLGAERRAESYRGGEAEGWKAPALAAAARRSRAWTAAEVETYLRGGKGPGGKAAAGPMADVAANLAQARSADVHAIAVYIASLMDGRRPARASH